MDIVLEPYSDWILYAACVLLLIFLVIAGVKAVKLLKAVNHLKPSFEHIDTNVKLAKIKAEAVKEKKQEDAAKNKKWTFLLPILAAIKHTYDNDDDLNGAKGLAKAAREVVQQKSEQRRLFAQFKKNYM